MSVCLPPPVSPRPVCLWLYCCCGMIFLMVIIGGLTRLTDSGLSMVEWRPFSGSFPPVSEGEWNRIFALYQQTPEYREINQDMTRESFKTIFWLEYIHRLWGRLIGLAFCIPMAVFWCKGWLTTSQKRHLPVILVLGSLQGLLGWYMVQSGLADRPQVSHYRLTAHLGLALVIYAYLFLLATTTTKPVFRPPHPPFTARITILMILSMITLTIFYGGLVAGMDGGLAYNHFPLMGEESILPPDFLMMEPWFLNFFENIGTVQFMHRLVAILTLLACLGFWLMGRLGHWPPSIRNPGTALAGMAILQVALGITTLLLAVPLLLAITHQAGALILLTISLWIISILFIKSPAH